MVEASGYQNIVVEFGHNGRAIDAKNLDGTPIIYGDEELKKKMTIIDAELRSHDEGTALDTDEELEESSGMNIKVEFDANGRAIDLKDQIEYYRNEPWTITGSPAAQLRSGDSKTGYCYWAYSDGKWRCIPE